MEINVINKLASELPIATPKAEPTPPPPPPPQSDAVAKPDTESKAPPPVRRPAPPLASAVTEGLQEAGVQTGALASPAAAESQPRGDASAEPRTGQEEKLAEATRAFMHSLAQAIADNRPAGNADAQGSGADTAVSGGSASAAAAEAYGGLVSRLESLVRELDGSSPPGPSGSSARQLNEAFQTLTGTAGATPSGSGGSAPALQDVLKTMIRNLQSSGDPTLASTGNVINTAA